MELIIGKLYLEAVNFYAEIGYSHLQKCRVHWYITHAITHTTLPRQ